MPKGRPPAWMMTQRPLRTPRSRSRGETANRVSVPEVLDDHRLAGQQGEARQRGGPDAHRGCSSPASSRPRLARTPERAAVGGELLDDPELDLEIPGGLGEGLVEERGQVEAREGLLPQLGHDGLLGRPLAELLLGPGPLGDGPGQLLRLLRHGLGGLPLPGRLLAEPLELPSALLLGQLPRVLPPLAPVQLGRLELDLLGLLEEVDEDADLRPQHGRDDRLGEEVDRPELVALEDLALVALEGGQEDDRGVLRAVALADQRGRLEAVQARHLDVHQDHGEVGVEDAHQRLLAGAGAHQVQAHAAEDGLQGEQVVRLVVHQQDGGLALGLHALSSPGRGPIPWTGPRKL